MRILLHTCCGPCASASVEKLINDGHNVTLFYSNSNINSKEEFDLRAKNATTLANHFNIPIIVDEYNHKQWASFVKGYEKEKERGARCSLCFRFSLSRTSDYARKNNYSNFSTTLTVSPHKNSKLLNQIGTQFPQYYHFDFKKQNGFKRSLEIADELNLYRQSYCGCEFSVRKSKPVQ